MNARTLRLPGVIAGAVFLALLVACGGEDTVCATGQIGNT